MGIIITIAMLLILLITMAVVYLKDFQSKQKTVMSFKEGLDITELPIVTFYQDNNGKRIKLNFLLDTGANLSIIDSRILDGIIYNMSEDKSNVTGLTGESIETSITNITFKYKDTEYSEDFQIVDMSSAFDNIKQTTGANLNGIIGNGFMQKYKYVLDFKELVAYSKN
jgi:predicted aspartyl protease